MAIERLHTDHERAVADFIAEFAAANEERIPACFRPADGSFADTVEQFAKHERGEGLPDGWVPSSSRFLFDGERILGVLNLRHWLTDSLLQFGGHVGYSVRPSERRKGYGTQLLKHAMTMAREREIERILITCASDNLASAGVIRACGGVFDNRIFFEPVGHEVDRFWIDLHSDPNS